MPQDRSLTVPGRRPGAPVSFARPARIIGAVLASSLLFVASAHAQPSPWEHAVSVLQVSFTGPIARGLSLVAIVIGGLMFAFSEGGGKRVIAGIVFGVAMAIGAANFMAWLFP